MRKGLFLLLVCSLSLISLVLLSNLFAISVDAKTIYVDSGESIQNAIDTANATDTIHINSGTYNEDLTISKTITLEGDNKENTVIIADTETKETIELQSASNVVIKNLKIKSKTSTQDYLPAIYFDTCSNCAVRSCIIEDSNIGLWLKKSSDFTVEDNIIKDNTKDGIMLSSSSTGNTIKDNTIKDNNGRGVFCDTTTSGNIIYLNDFLNNAVNARDSGSNTWHYSGDGNYWSDYDDYDSDNDGYGDNPYTKNGVNDQYVRGYFLNPEPEAYIDSISPNPATVGQSVTFRGHGSDDGSISNYEWKADGTTIGNQAEITYSFSQSKTYTITFRVKDNDEKWSDTVSDTITVNPSEGDDDNGDNQKPTATIDTISSTKASYGTDIYFSGYGTDPDGDELTFKWSSSVDGVLSTSQSFYYSDLSVGTHTIYFRVKDSDDQWSDYASQTVEITGDSGDTNNKPNADAGGPYYAKIDEIVKLNGSKSSDPDGDSLTYAWEFGDGSTGTSKTIHHKYTEIKTYYINLTVTDEHDLKDTDQTTITITKQGSNNNNNQNNDNTDEDTDKIVIPGFEIISLMIGLIIVIIYHKKKN